MRRATAFAPGSIGNVGPGFDVLGLAVEGLGDRVTVELTGGAAEVKEVTGRDADSVPRDPSRNVASIAATAWLRGAGLKENVIVSVEKGLPLAGGLGGSAASSVAGAMAASLAAGDGRDLTAVMTAALAGEGRVAGRHLDNIAASALGGLALSRCADPVDAVRVPVAASWWLVLLTPRVRIRTRESRAILPQTWERERWIQQMANTAGLLHAFASGDAALLRRSLHDLYAEPLRASLIPNFPQVKAAALGEGALGCSISGGGPTIFAITEKEDQHVAQAMQKAMGETESVLHVAPIASQGVRAV